MSEFADLLAQLRLSEPSQVDAASEPFGTAWLARHGLGVDLAAAGYVEEEFLVSGVADRWTWDDRLRAVPLGGAPYTTRVLVRRPADPARFSGSVQIEPHHPDEDRALTWQAIAPWILRSGHAHVGVTQDPAAFQDLAAWDDGRYGTLALADSTQRWEVLGQVAAMLRQDPAVLLAGTPAARVIGSGWSMTGTFWRTFLGEGFHEHCSVGGHTALDGYVICISSGGAGRAGYASLRDGAVLDPDDPRRTVMPHGVPIVELLSEGESETHRAVLRDDADGPADLYRLYQVAGSAHIATGVPGITTNAKQLRERGWTPRPREIVEERSDARMDVVARAVFDALERWLTAGVAPPRASRFTYGDPAGPGTRGLMTESEPLARDSDGNVVGGVRTAWVDVPVARYLPHSTPRPGACLPAAHAPYSDPALLADLIGHKEPFTQEELARRYGSRAAYLEQFDRRTRELVDAGWLLAEEATELVASARDHCAPW